MIETVHVKVRKEYNINDKLKRFLFAFNYILGGGGQ